MAAPGPPWTDRRQGSDRRRLDGGPPAGRSERRLILQRRVLDLPRHWLADRPAEAPPREAHRAF